LTKWQLRLSSSHTWMMKEIDKMTSTAKRSKISNCLLIGIFFLALLAISAIIIPSLFMSRAQKLFGAPSPEITVRQRITLSISIVLQADGLTQAVDLSDEDVKFTINPGESVPSITGRLWDAGLIDNPGVFRNYLQYSGLDTSLKAGDYTLSPALTPLEIAQVMQSSISAEITLTILPGWRVEEIANALPSSGFTISQEEFTDAINSHPEGYSFSVCVADHTLEGFLFPGSYTVARGTTIQDLLPQILMNFEAQVSPELRSGFATQGIDVCQAVTLASIIQREAVLDEEMPIIASVFYNRLNNGAELASDPTVQYALGYNQSQGTWWTNPLSTQDLQFDSPYNTYLYPGLPPGPISNPGLSALKSVAFPAQTPYYYFRAACDDSGRHLFSETYSEHLANQCP
jgi:UPF0755 protein